MNEFGKASMNEMRERLSCFELWGGNRSADHPVELPGLAGWVYSEPLDSGSGGGDVHYLSVCSRGKISRVAVADVAGHGSVVSSMGENLREILQRHTDSWDQSTLMQELNKAFAHKAVESQYATAAVLGFYFDTGELLFSGAGHPPMLWYRAQEKSWDLLQDTTPFSVNIVDLPLGLIAGTAYCQTAVQLGAGDVIVLYTDGITEATDPAGNPLGQDGLLRLARSVAVESAADTCRALLSGVHEYRGNRPRQDDETLVVLRHSR